MGGVRTPEKMKIKKLDLSRGDFTILDTDCRQMSSIPTVDLHF